MLSFSHICDRKRRILTRSEHRNVQKAVQIVGTRTAFPPRRGIGWYGKATKGADNMKQWISLLLTVLLLCMPAAALAQPSEEELSIGAPSAILIERETGTVLYEKNADERLSPASVT